MNDNEINKDLSKPKWKGGVAKDNPEWLAWAADRARERIKERQRKKELKSSNVFIANVHFTITDETYYVSPTESHYSSIYKSDSIEKTKELLIKDNWKPSGKVSRWDYINVDMFDRNYELIAIWKENSD